MTERLSSRNPLSIEQELISRRQFIKVLGIAGLVLGAELSGGVRLNPSTFRFPKELIHRDVVNNPNYLKIEIGKSPQT